MKLANDPATLAFAAAIRGGDVGVLTALLAADPTLATERFGNPSESRTALHVATDWPANFPRAGETIAILVASGAPVDGRFVGAHEETALHWAASADDVAAIDALLDAGAHIEASGAVLTGGTPLSDAVIFEQWKAARRLLDRGASTTIWQAAALGETDRLSRHLAEDFTTVDDITNACWHACRAGQVEAAKLLVAQGADIDWVGHDDLSCRQVGTDSGKSGMVAWLRTL